MRHWEEKKTPELPPPTTLEEAYSRIHCLSLEDFEPRGRTWREDVELAAITLLSLALRLEGCSHSQCSYLATNVLGTCDRHSPYRNDSLEPIVRWTFGDVFLERSMKAIISTLHMAPRWGAPAQRHNVLFRKGEKDADP